MYSLAGQQAKAMMAYQKANSWQELFTLALSEKRTAADIKLLAVDVAGKFFLHTVGPLNAYFLALV